MFQEFIDMAVCFIKLYAPLLFSNCMLWY